MEGRKRVWAALRGKPLNSPPKGEILITPRLLKEFPCENLQAVLAYLNADLVVLPIDQNTNSLLWKSWSKTNYFVFGLLQGPISFLAEELGWHRLSYLLLKKPGEARDIMNKYVMSNLQWVNSALDNGCDGIILADDLAGDRGPLISPSLLQENYFSLIAHLLQKTANRQIPWIFHSDGNILGLLNHIRQIGFWGIHGLQPTVGIGPENFQTADFLNWVYWGNFEFEGAGKLKGTNEAEAEVEQLLTDWSGFPGYIFGSSGGLYEGLSPQIIKTAYDKVNSWGSDKYE